MSETKMLINYLPGEECRVAVVSDGRLEELHAERAGAVSTVGNIYVGKVMNVEPAIQAAFVDFGVGINGFLHVSDVHPQYFPGEDDETTERIGKKTPRRDRPPIQQCLRRGQEVIVQVLKEGINTKGPTLTSYLSIPGRYLVMLPNMDKSGVSKKVEDEEARKEMKAILDQLELPEGFGFIIRTAGVGRNKTELKRDLAYLHRLWTDIEKRQKTGSGPRLLYAESDLLMRALRDIWNSDVSEIIIDNESAIRRAAKFMKIVAPRGTTKLLHYNMGAPMFHVFGLEDQITQIHSREVPLPSGGYLVIDEAEALIAIDVNSGKSRESRDSETNAYRTNEEAVDEICRQLKLRDVGGLVLCDLIDMVNRKHRKDIENQFKERLKRDRAATRTLPVSEFGIVEMTRQRMKGSFQSTHFAECPHCAGRGKLRRPDSVSADAMRDLQALLDRPQVSKVEMVVSSRMAAELLSNKRQAISRMEFHTKKHVDVRISDAVGLDRVTFYAYDGQGADIELEKLSQPKVPKELPEWKYAVESGETDWSVDTASEQAELPPELVQEPSVEELDLITDEGDSDDQGWVKDKAGVPQQRGEQGEQVEGRGRGRRRRRRGRGGRSEDGQQGGPQQQQRQQQQPQQRQQGTPIHGPGAAPAPSGDFGSWDVGASEVRPLQPVGEQSDGDGQMPADSNGQTGQNSSGDGEGGGRKRRRRRRRRGRGGAPQGGSGGEFNGQPGQAMPEGEHPIHEESDDSDEAVSAGDSSWDVAPGEVRPAVQPVQRPAPQPVAKPVPQPSKTAPSRPAGPPLVVRYEIKRRPKLDEFFRPIVDENGDAVMEEIQVPVYQPVNQPAAQPTRATESSTQHIADRMDDSEKAVAAQAPVDESDESDDDGEPEEGASGGEGLANQAQGNGEDGTKRKRRRRGGRGRNKNRDGAPRSDVPANAGPGGPPPAPPVQRPAPRAEKPREERPRGGASQASSARSSSPRNAPAPATPAKASPPVQIPGVPGVVKPVRTLYGTNRSKLTASKAASVMKARRD